MSKQEIQSRFGVDSSNSSVLKALEELLLLFNLDLEDLYINWESFCLAKIRQANEEVEEVELNMANISELQQYIAKNIEKKSKAINLQSSAKKSRRVTSSPMGAMLDFLPSTPISVSKRKFNGNSDMRNKKSRSSMLSSSPTRLDSDVSYMDSPSIMATEEVDISKSGEILLTLNSKISLGDGLDFEAANGVQLAANSDASKYKFRIMRQKLLEASDVLDEQIDAFAERILEANPDLVLGNPNVVSQTEITAVGRITPDSPLTPYDVPLNKESLSLELSRALGLGERIKLNLSGISNFGFFPGQIVALKGHNGNGNHFSVTKVVEPPVYGPATCTGLDIEKYSSSINGDKLKVVVAAGPYTTNNNLDFSVLSNLVEKINNETKPHYVILFGPFIDYAHAKVLDGSIEDCVGNNVKTLDDVFNVLVSPILKKIDPAVQVILIPSTNDAVSKHPSYPQDSFERKQIQLPKNFKCFSNPSTFQLNECLIGVSNNDIFKDLKDVVGGEVNEANRFDRIANYILEQGRYYPLFPGGVQKLKMKLATPAPDASQFKVDQISGANLDIPYLGLTEFVELTPDIIIVPSQLRFFARVVKNVLVINPSYFMNPRKTGTYALLNINAPTTESLTPVKEDLYLNDVWKRCRVDIVRS